MKAIVVTAIGIYKKFISPFLPNSCRFHPTCSTYCAEAVDRFGVIKGLWLFAGRIIKCHPFHPGGYDPLQRLDKSS